MAAQEPWPSLEDPRYIHLSQQYASRLCKRSSIVLRSRSHGFIACKFSALSFLLIGILWLDRKKKEDEKLAIMTKFDITSIGSFTSKRLNDIFMLNNTSGACKDIASFQDIEFEDGIALLGIVDGDGRQGHIYHYFLIRQDSGKYSILSSYGSDLVSIYQFETSLKPAYFTSFVKSLKKDKRNPTPRVQKIDVARVAGFMRTHFLNPRFKINQPKTQEFKDEEYDESTDQKLFSKNNPEDITGEIKKYTGIGFNVVQFISILPEIHREIEAVVTKPIESQEDHTAEIIEEQHAVKEDVEREEAEEAEREAEEAEVEGAEVEKGAEVAEVEKGAEVAEVKKEEKGAEVEKGEKGESMKEPAEELEKKAGGRKTRRFKKSKRRKYVTIRRKRRI
jgi:hypothetical protein